MDPGSPFPLEVVVEGVPVSAQAKRSKSRAQWKERIFDEARSRRGPEDNIAALDLRVLAVTIFYFPSAPMEGDIDNIVKPIIDALIGVAYLDDRNIERVTVQKFEPGLDWAFARPTRCLASALATPPPFIYIRVDDDLTWRRLS